MKRINLLLLLLLGAVASCSKKQPESLLTKWNHKITKESSFDRIIASSSLNENQCFKDIFDVQTLKKEIADLEKKYAGGEKVQGTWKHLDLSKLPIPQANFLKTYGERLGHLKDPESIDYSSCEDVPCIYNKIYKKENYVAGYVHYLWFLKLGHMLSADNKVPDQESEEAGIYNGKEIPLQSYLYNDKELFGLWRLTHLLKHPYTSLNYLRETQRIPRSEKIEGRPSEVCGVASSKGWVILNDGCLSVYGVQLDTGDLYESVTHELAHHVDFETGRGTRELYRSHKKDYLDLIGMWSEEFVKDNGEQERQWHIKSRENLVSSYAGTLPQENFAETLAYFRVDPEHTKRRATKDHYKFISDNFYEGKNFENETLLREWIVAYKVESEREVIRAVIDCSEAGPSNFKKSSFLSLNDFKYRPSPGSMNCLSWRMEEVVQSLMKKVALNEPDGCRVFGWKELQVKWTAEMKVALKEILNRYLEEVQMYKDYIGRIQSFYADIEDRTLSRESYISCYKEANEVGCYEELITLKAREKISKLKVSPTQEKELVELYTSVHSYAQVSTDVKASYRTFVGAHLEKIRFETDELWRSCRTGPQSDDFPPKGSFFQIAEGYMVSSLYNCINSSAPDALKRVVRNLEVDGTKIQNPKEEVILIDEVKPHLLTMLKERFEAESMREFNEIRNFIKKEDGSTREGLLADFSWVKDVVDQEEFDKSCYSEALRMLPYNPLFHIKNKVFSELIKNRICSDISSSPEYKKWISESEYMFRDIVFKEVEEILYRVGEERARTCLEKFPITNSVSRIKYRSERESCLTVNWNEVEEKVIEELKQHPYVVKFKFNSDDFRPEISKNGRRTQLKIIKDKFN